MNSKIKILANPWMYFVVGASPSVPLFYFFIEKQMSLSWFLSFSILYAFIYYPILNLYRLRALGIEEKFSIWQILFTLRFKHYSKLKTGGLKKV